MVQHKAPFSLGHLPISQISGPAALNGLLDTVQVPSPQPEKASISLLRLDMSSMDKQSLGFSASGICHLIFIICHQWI